MKLKIQKIFVKDRTSKAGKPYKSVSITANDGQVDTYFNTFGGKWNEGWTVGDEIDVEVERYGEYQGKPTYNIKPPARGADLTQFTTTMQLMNTKLDKILSLLNKEKPLPNNGPDDIQDDLPF